MAFKSVKAYNEERFGGFFLLRNDGDFADVVFLYQSVDDVLVADTHYIKAADYSGYVHCCGRGCPACAKGIRVQTKLFIPVYNINDGEIQFFDRSMRFENQLNHDVFSRFPNPSEYVFRITRHGASGDVNTTYNITVVGKNTMMSYDKILSKFHATFPEYYERICKEYSASELNTMLNTSSTEATYETDMPSYSVTPRGIVNATPTPVVPDMSIPDVTVESTDIDDVELADVDNVVF